MVLLAELADRSGLTVGMSWAMSNCGIAWRIHDPGVVLTHLAVAIANGADCLADMAVLRNQPELFDPVASAATARSRGLRLVVLNAFVAALPIPVPVQPRSERVRVLVGVTFSSLQNASNVSKVSSGCSVTTSG